MWDKQSAITKLGDLIDPNFRHRPQVLHRADFFNELLLFCGGKSWSFTMKRSGGDAGGELSPAEPIHHAVGIAWLAYLVMWPQESVCSNLQSVWGCDLRDITKQDFALVADVATRLATAIGFQARTWPGEV